MKNKYEQEEIDNAVQLMGDIPVRPEKMEYELFVETRRQMNLTNRLNKMGSFHHISAELIPKLGEDGKLRIPVEWIGKTKGTTYENLEKQKQSKTELFGYYMMKDNKDAAQKVMDGIGVIDNKIYMQSPEYKKQIQEKMEVEKTRLELDKQTRILKARSIGK